MSGVATAHELTRGLGAILAPEMPAKIKMDRLYRELSKRAPRVTRRRVRALFFGEVARVDYEEMRALEELRAEEELKRAKREFAASAIILATHHAEAGEAVAREELLEIGRRYGAMDLPRDAGAAR